MSRRCNAVRVGRPEASAVRSWGKGIAGSFAGEATRATSGPAWPHARSPAFTGSGCIGWVAPFVRFGAAVTSGG
jgi:hypothetical protein